MEFEKLNHHSKRAAKCLAKHERSKKEMKKQKDKKWRRINKYTCQKCGKGRSSLKWARAKSRICTKCGHTEVNENQPSLFEKGNE